MKQPHRQRDLLAGDPARYALAIPTCEELAQRVTNIRAQPESLGHRRGGQAVRHESALDVAAPGRREGGDLAHPLPQRPGRTGVREHEDRATHPAQVDVVAVGAKRDVVAEPRRHLRCIGHATHPGQHRGVIQARPFLRAQPDALPQPRSKPPGPQDVLHRLPKAEVHGKGERGQQLGQRNTRVPSVAIHRVSIGASAQSSCDVRRLAA